MKLRSVMVVTSVLVSGVVLAGCSSTMSPGSAAVVDGTSISMADADRAAVVYCQLAQFSAQQQGGGAVENADARRQAVSELISQRVAESIADDEDITLSASDWKFSSADRAQVAQALPDADLDDVVAVLEQSQRTYAIAERLGVEETGEKATEENAQQIQQAGRAVLAKAVAAADVSIDPRFGLDPNGEDVAETGSLSVSSDLLAEDAPRTLPATQRCA